MLQYLLNATAIWLLSLLLFDLFLRNESYHGYNRIYLLLTFLLGSFLPLFNWPHENGPLLQGTLQRPVQQVITAKENVVNSTIPAPNSLGWGRLLIIMYLVGVAIALCLFIIDIVKLMRFYRMGKRSEEGEWLIIETGENHAPFSFLNTLFVNDKQQYSTIEWHIILAHEKRHQALLHIADLVYLQISRIVFWFHPLVYIYNKRVLLVHEYQADKTAAPPRLYGKFLIEQAVFQSAPALSHSFNRSPIKKRIVMLTHKSPKIAKIKLLLFIPLVIVCILCFSQNSFSKKPVKEGNTCKFRGNTIEFLAPKQPDSYLYTDEVTGETYRKPITWPMPPIKANGERVYDPVKDKNVEPPALKSNYKNLAVYIMQSSKKEMAALDDGKYFIDVADVVIDAKGRVVYYDNQGVFKIGEDINKQIKRKQDIDNKITSLMNSAPLFEPARFNNTPVAFLMNSVTCFSYGYNTGWDFTVKGHQIIWDITSNIKPVND